MNITIVTIPHNQQRYNTVGDYLTDGQGNTTILVSDLGDQQMQFLIALHEQVELTLCAQHGVTDQMIDAFDFAFAAQRDPTDPSEPGDDPAAPYYQEHQFATQVEKMMAVQLGVNWDDYMNRSAELMRTYSP